MKPPRRILVIALRRLGDLLLATPLIRSLKAAWPEAAVDVLVAAGNEGMLEGNADVARVIAFRRGAGPWPLLRTVGRRYDLAVNLQPEDRGHLLALLAAPRRAAILPPPGEPGHRWKRWLSHYTVPADLHNQHAVVQALRLADALGVPRIPAVQPPRGSATALAAALPTGWRTGRAYAVLHPAPMYRYKAWPDAAWAMLVQGLRARGLSVVVTGGPVPEERARAEALATIDPPNVVSLAGRLGFADLTALLETAALYVGPDTAITHLAAACGTPTIALFGPSNPVAWGPWPRGCAIASGSPWRFVDATQAHGGVTLLQGTQARWPGCIPCLKEGCERRLDSPSDCLDQLSPARVLGAIDQMLGTARPNTG